MISNMLTSSKIKLKSKKGSLLVLSYLVIIVLLGMGSAFLLLSTNEGKISERQRLATVAFHIAEAGIERGLYDVRQDFVNDSTPSWEDSNINGFAIGPNTAAYYTIPYSDSTLNGGSYAVELKNVAGQDHIWIQSTGTISGVSHTLQVYVKMIDLSPWNNAIFAGAGQAGMIINGNVDIRGSVHILGSGLNPGDYAIDLGGTAQLVGNNYNGLSSSLVAKVPALPTVSYNGENVGSLSAELRVKKGLVGLSGSATVGETDVSGNAVKETVDSSYVTEGFGGNSGSSAVYSDNGSSNIYDLGDAVEFPSITNTAYGGYGSYMDYLKANSVVISSDITVTPTSSSFFHGDGADFASSTNALEHDGSGNIQIKGIVYFDNASDFTIDRQGAAKTVEYTGTGSLVTEGNINIKADLVTSGNNSYPNNIIGFMTPNDINLGVGSQVDIMGLFYAENQVVVDKQTDIMGSIVTNYFDLGTNVPSIFQVPATNANLPPGLIGSGNSKWYALVAWIKI